MEDDRNAALWNHMQSKDLASFDRNRFRLEYVVRRMRRLVKGGAPKLLNIGVGSGYMERYAASQGFEVMGLDPTPEAIVGLKSAGIGGEIGFMQNMPFDDNTFDCVIASEVMEHLQQDVSDAGLAEIARVLKPGGIFMGTVPYDENIAQYEVYCTKCDEYFHPWGHVRSFDESVMRRELAPHFNVREVKRAVFSDFRSTNPKRLAKSWARWLLSRFEKNISLPNLFFYGTVKKSG